MTSSLASQLAGIQSHNAARLSGAGAPTARDSYLFPPRVAAEQDYETVHALGVSGWEQLVESDAALAQWRGAELLFGDDSVRTDRLTLPASANREIDAAVAEFLYLVGPMLRSRSVAKCLEWLVRRFRVHEFTPGVVLRAFLPLHLTPQFVRMLQLLHLQKVPEARFLVAVQKAGTPLPTSALVHALGGNVDLLRWVADASVPAGVTEQLGDAAGRRGHVGFWTSTLVQFCLTHVRDSGAASRSRADAQAVLAVLLPAALHMLHGARGDQEAGVGALMVLSATAAAFPLSAASVRGVLEHVARAAAAHHAETARAGVACCFALCASAAHAGETERLLTADTLAHLLRVSALRALVLRSSQDHDLAPFLTQLLAALADALPDAAATELLDALLAADSVPAALKQRAVEQLLTAPQDDTAHAARVGVLAAARQRVPHVFDAAVHAGGDAAWAGVGAVLSAAAQGEATGAAPDAALFLGLQSAEETQRTLALRQLLDAVDAGSVQADDALVREALVGALRDAPQALLQEVYERRGEVLLRALGPARVLDAVCARLARAERVSVREYKVQVRFLLDAVLPRAPQLDARVWREALFPHLLATAAAPKLAAAVAALVEHAAGARSAPPASLQSLCAAVRKHASATLADDAPAYNVRAAAAIAADLAQADHDVLAAHAEALLAHIATDATAPAGALALLVLTHLLEQREALGEPLWAALALQASTLLAQRGLLAVREGGAPPAEHDTVPLEVARRLHAKLSRRHLRAAGVQLLRVAAKQLPVPQDAPLFAAVQQRDAPGAQLLVHLYQVVHGADVGHCAEAVMPAVFARVRRGAPALLAGLAAAPAGAPEAPLAGGSLAATAARLQQGGAVPACDAALRITALRQLAALLAAPGAAAFDYQALLPSVLVSLQDEQRAVRSAAGGVLAALAALAERGATEIYGYDALYGSGASAALQYLDGATYTRYVHALAEHAEACANDAGFLRAANGALLVRGKRDATLRDGVVCYLLSHVVCWASLPARVALLDAVREVQAPCKVDVVQPLLREVLAPAAPAAGARAPPAPTDDALYATYLDLLLATYSAGAAPALSADAWAHFLAALRADARQSGALPAAALHALAHGLCAALPVARQREAFEALAEAVADPARRAAAGASEALRTLPVHDAVLVEVLGALSGAIVERALDEAPGTKRARGAGGAGEAQVHAAVVLITVLEALQGRQAAPSAPLVAALFDVVRAAVEMHATLLFNAEYLLQLAMQCLCGVFDALPALSAEVAQAVRADTIVAAIQVSSNTQSINHALLLLTRFARLDAELVLHNVMPIFTFVGSSVLQRDDRFTLAVVEQTLRCIVPAFVEAVRPKAQRAADPRLALWLETRGVLRIFSDAAAHIPRHRRAVFFRRLVEVLGEREFLAPVCMLLVDRAVGRVTRAPKDAASVLQLPLGVLAAAPRALRVQALGEVWAEAVRLLHRDAGSSLEVLLDGEHANGREHSEAHASAARQAYALVVFVEAALGADAEAQPGDAEALTALVWSTLTLTAPDAAFATTVERVRLLAFRALPLDAALRMALALLRGEAPAGAAPAEAAGVALLDDRLAALAPEARAAAAARMPALDEALVALWRSHRGTPLGDAALATLHTSVAGSVREEHAALAPLLPALLVPPSEADAAVLALLPLLLERLGVRALAHLAALVPFCAEVVQDSKGADEPARVAGALETLCACVRALPQFMQAYAERAVRLLTDAEVQLLVRQRALRAVRAAHRRLHDALVHRLPTGGVLDAVVRVWGSAASPPSAVTAPTLAALLAVVHHALREMPREAVAVCYKPAFRFLLTAFDLRRAHAAALGERALSSIEERALAAFVALALKLSETQFRPLFLRTVDWAVVDLLPEGGEADASARAALSARSLVLYRLVSALLDQLRGVFVAFYAVLLEPALETLRASAAGEVDAALWRACVRSMDLSAEYDEGTFWNASSVGKVAEPLLAQLPRLAKEEDATVQQEDAALLTRTLLALVGVVPDDACLRTVNTALLKRAATPELTVRVLALSTAAALWEAHGVALLGFVPETVAALSELLDDADPRAASAALRLRVAIERALGEPLDAYLE